MEKFTSKYYGLLLGCALSVASYGLAYTFVVPIFTVMPLGLLTLYDCDEVCLVIGISFGFVSSLSFVIFYGLKYGFTKRQMSFVFLCGWFVIHIFVCVLVFNDKINHPDAGVFYYSVISFPYSGLDLFLWGFC